MTAGLPVAELSAEQARAELARLADEIARADRAYHQQDAPEISDADYDALKRRNAEIEARFPELKRTDSPSGRVGAAPSEGFAKVRHARRMLSLENAFEPDEIAEFDARIRRYLGLGDDAPLSVAGISSMVRAFAVTFSPVSPSPRVAACTSAPFS